MTEDAALVVVIDDDEATCRAVARMLTATGYRVRTFTTAREYLDDIDAAVPACILADLRMPDVDGLALFRAMHDGGIETPTVFMTGSGHIPTVVEVMKEGALDLLAKPFTSDELSGAIVRATQSARRMGDDRRALAAAWHQLERVTPREAEVCALVACGLLNKRVAARIGTTEKTVKVHRGRVMQKLHAASLADLVRFVEGLIVERDRHFVKLDGVEIRRPRAADIIIETMLRERAATLTTVGAGVDQLTMTHPG
jgi:FixJ family two-component response regulator